MLLLNQQEISAEQFPNNETKVKDFDENILPDRNVLEFKYFDDSDLIRLMFVKWRLDELQTPCTLVIRYMPYSRMDRKIPGSLFTLQYVCRFINILQFKEVVVIEPHSQKTMELLEHAVAVYPVMDWLPDIMTEIGFSDNDRIVFPDKGAAERYRNYGLKDSCVFEKTRNPITGRQDICVFEKTRNPITGRIEGMKQKEGTIPQGAKCIIIDDLCSAGGTFLLAGNSLRENGAGEVYLIVSHCEPTVFDGKLLADDSPIDRIYTSDSMMNRPHRKIKYLPVNIDRYV